MNRSLVCLPKPIWSSAAITDSRPEHSVPTVSTLADATKRTLSHAQAASLPLSPLRLRIESRREVVGLGRLPLQLLLLLCAAAAASAAAVLGRFLAGLLAQPFDSVRDADSDLGLARFCWPCWRQLLVRLAISAASLCLALEILAFAALLRRDTSSANILSSQLSSIAVSPANNGGVLAPGHSPLLKSRRPLAKYVMFWISWSVLGTDPCLNRGATSGRLADAAA